MDQTVDDTQLKELAQLSETEHYNMKNRYRHQRQTMDFAEKKRMPIDENSVRDMLRNQHIFRWKMENELSTYTHEKDKAQFEYGLL